LTNGDDKIAFNTSQGETYKFVNYSKIGLDKYNKVIATEDFNCNDTYWVADSEGFSMVNKGLYVTNMLSEYKGDDLIVSAPDLGKNFD
jgi:hypothetical protein